MVFHAAAYKHVPLMESNPCEAVRVNVFGTMNVADHAVKYGVERFVMVSTDKAVNPDEYHGGLKRLAEIYVQSLKCGHSGWFASRNHPFYHDSFWERVGI